MGPPVASPIVGQVIDAPRRGVSSERAVTALTAGAVIGVVEVVFASSFAALIFAGPLAPHVADGVGLNLAAAAVILGVLAWLAGARGIIGSTQDGPAAVLAVVVASIAAGMATTGEDAFLTVVATIATTTILAGGVFLALGAFRLGNLARFVPYPVVGGFLAGSGWLLASGGVEVAARIAPRLRTLDDLATLDAIVRWGPALAFGVALLVVTRAVDRPFVIPAALALGLSAFVLSMLATGSSIEDAEAGGWLLGPFPEGRLWQPWAVRSVAGADWSTVLSQAGGIGTAVLVSVLAFLLNVTGTELTLGEDLDSNAELRSAGVANLFGGAVGGVPGFHALSVTALAHRMRAGARATGLVAAAVAVAALLFGSSLVALFPRMLLAGTLLFLGLGFLVEWLIDARRTMPIGEYSIVVVILATIVVWGLLPGVAVGLVLAVVLFAVSYSRTDLVRQSVPGTAYRSNVDRSPAEQGVLRELAGQVHVMRLQGFIFFGTANRLFERIHERAWSASDPPLRFLILDFRRVTGVDSSAALSFRKSAKLAANRGFELVLTSIPDELRGQLEQAGVREESGTVRFEPDLDRGAQRFEDALLAEAAAKASPTDDDVWSQLGEGAADLAARLGPYLERLEIPEDHVLIRQHDPPDDVFVLESGRLTVEYETDQGERLRLRTVAPGAVLGEVAVYARMPRTASVIADVPSVVQRLSRESLDRIEAEQPELASAIHRWFAKLLALRLADTIRSVDALLR